MEVFEGEKERERGRRGRRREREREHEVIPQLYGVKTPRLSAHPLLVLFMLFKIDMTRKQHAILG